MILVIGATGNVGKELVPQLLNKDVPVRILTRDERKVIDLGKKVEVAVGDLNNPETLAPALKGIDRLYFVAPGTPQVVSLLEAAKQAGVSHVVKLSTIEAD